MFEETLCHWRTFSRTATIPLNKISGIQTVQGSLSLKAALQPLLSKAVPSIGTCLEFGKEFQVMQENDFFFISTSLEGSSMDLWSQLNRITLVIFHWKGMIMIFIGFEKDFNV